MNFGKALCKCGGHVWSAVEPGTAHLVNDKLALIGVTWAQVGTKKCTRPGCTATKQVVREGCFGFEGLFINPKTRTMVLETDKTTGWGRSIRHPQDVLALKPYTHAVALVWLGVPATA